MVNEFYESVNSFTYNGKNSLDMGLFVMEKGGAYGNAQAAIETINVPARGNLILNNKVDELDNEEFSDYEKAYRCCVAADEGADLENMARNIYSWLFKSVEYTKLYDTYDREYYKLAYIGTQVTIEELAMKMLGSIEIKFICKAFKRAIKGDRKIEVISETTLYNTEGFTSKPYIKITGSGNATLYINNRAHGFKEINGYIEIDSELMNAYKGDILQNNKMLTPLFPKLAAGENNISWIGNISKIEIEPRWCSL